MNQAEMSNRTEIANTIVQQMGGMGRFRAMLNSTPVVLAQGAHLGFRFSRSKAGNYATVRLDADDTYTLTISRVSARGVKHIKELQGLFAEDLVRCFERGTGLFLRF